MIAPNIQCPPHCGALCLPPLHSVVSRAPREQERRSPGLALALSPCVRAIDKLCRFHANLPHPRDPPLPLPALLARPQRVCYTAGNVRAGVVARREEIGEGGSAMSGAPGAPPPSQPLPALAPLVLPRLERAMVARALARAGEAPGV